jgi:hypothetical protein
MGTTESAQARRKRGCLAWATGQLGLSLGGLSSALRGGEERGEKGNGGEGKEVKSSLQALKLDCLV